MNYNTVSSYQLLSQGNVTSESAFPLASGGSTRAVLVLPSIVSSGSIDGRHFRIRVAFKITGGTTTNFTPAVYWNSGSNTNLTTFTSDVKLMSLAAFAVNSTTRMCELDGDLLWDATSNRLLGSYYAISDPVGGNPTYTARAIMTTSPPTPSTVPAIGFFVTGLFSASNAGNLVTLTDFTLDIV